MYKKITYISLIFLFIASCESMDSVKRGLTGAKAKSADEFLVKKKDPLILPPDYENLPTPDEATSASEEISIFEKSLENAVEENPTASNSVEESILKKIRSK
tara:strand:+ start:1906 stop:2211 length:306 start_codon:yes stop_codon:yes gene_type:complete